MRHLVVVARAARFTLYGGCEKEMGWPFAHLCYDCLDGEPCEGNAPWMGYSSYGKKVEMFGENAYKEHFVCDGVFRKHAKWFKTQQWPASQLFRTEEEFAAWQATQRKLNHLLSTATAVSDSSSGSDYNPATDPDASGEEEESDASDSEEEAAAMASHSTAAADAAAGLRSLTAESRGALGPGGSGLEQMGRSDMRAILRQLPHGYWQGYCANATDEWMRDTLRDFVPSSVGLRLSRRLGEDSVENLCRALAKAKDLPASNREAAIGEMIDQLKVQSALEYQTNFDRSLDVLPPLVGGAVGRV